MSSARTDRFLTASSWILLIGWDLFRFSLTVADPDLWGHLRFGDDIVRTGAIVQRDVYSYRTGDQTWMNHEWLAEVVFAWVYGRAGPAGLVALKIVVGLAILVGMFAFSRRHGLDRFASLVLVLLVCEPLRMGLGTIRPHLFTYGLFFVELWLIVRAERGRDWWLWVVPLVLALWSNLHGGVLAGAGMMGLWGLGRFGSLAGDRSRSAPHMAAGVAHVALLLLVSGLALTLNPYGAALPRFLLRTATVPRPEIHEWEPLALVSLAGLNYVVLLAAGVWGLVDSRRPRSLATVLMVSVAATLPLLAARHFPLFALTVFVMTGEHIADAWDRRRPGWPVSFGGRAWLGVLGLAAGVLGAAFAVPKIGCIRLDPGWFPFPARVVALLESGGVRGNMAVPFEWGEYVIWHLGPGVKVSNDGRRETVYSDAVYRQSLDFDHGTGSWDALLREWPTDMVLAPHGSPTANLMARTKGWVPVYGDTLCLLFVRAGSDTIDRLLATPMPEVPDDGGGLCFPETPPQRVVRARSAP